MANIFGQRILSQPLVNDRYQFNRNHHFYYKYHYVSVAVISLSLSSLFIIIIMAFLAIIDYKARYVYYYDVINLFIFTRFSKQIWEWYSFLKLTNACWECPVDMMYITTKYWNTMSLVGRRWLFAWCAAGSPAGEAAATVFREQWYATRLYRAWAKSHWCWSESYRPSSR